MSGRKRTTRVERIADGMLAVALAGSALGMGAVHRPVLLALAIPIFAGAIVSAAWLRPRSARISAPAIVAGLLAAYTLLQAVPLPMGLLRALAPANADIWARCLRTFGEVGPSWAPVSLDPGATYSEAVRWLLYAAVFSLAVSTAARRGADWGVAAVFLTGSVVALVTLAHGLAGATTVYGFYKPHFGLVPWHVSPLLNPNNLAGYLNLSILCGLGLLIARRPFLPRWVSGLGAAVMLGVEVISASRAGVAVLPLGLLVLGLFARWSHRTPHAHAENAGDHGAPGRRDGGGVARASSWLLIAAVAGGLCLALLGATLETWRELYDKNLEKLGMVFWTRPLLADFPWFGIGRGAFESVFPAYRPGGDYIVFTHAENFPAQWLSEWGVPVGLLALGAFGWLCRPRNLGLRRSAVAAGAWTGAFVLLAQNLLDLALEVPAVSIALAAALGSLWGDAYRRGRPGRTGYALDALTGLRAYPAVLAAGAGLVGIAVFGAVKNANTHVSQEKRAVYDSVVALRDLSGGRPTGDELGHFRTDLRAATLRHPAEPYFALAGAMALEVAKEGDPLPWVARAIEREPRNALAHMMLSNLLLSRGKKSQGLLEARIAVEASPGLAGWAADRALVVTRVYDELLAIVPAGLAGAPVFEALAARTSAEKEHAQYVRLWREALERNPRAIQPHLALAGDLLRQLHAAGGTLCGGTSSGEPLGTCRGEFDEHLASVERVLPRASAAAQVRASYFLEVSRVADAERLLAGACARVDDRVDCLRARVGVASRLRGAEPLASVAKELVALACTSPEPCAQACMFVGDTMNARGDWGGAVTYFTRAAAVESTEAAWLRVAEASSRLGSHVRAAEALERVSELRGKPDPALAARIREERMQAILPR